MKFSCSLTLLAVLVACHTVALADPLEELQKTKVYRRTLSNRVLPLSSLYNEKWFDRRTWFGRVFLEEEGATYLFSWLGTDRSPPPERNFSGSMVTVDKTAEYLLATRDFVTPAFKKIVVTILLPHPRSAVACDGGLVEKCKTLKPTPTERFKTDTVILQSISSESIQTTNNTCMYLVRLPHSGILQAAVENCADKTELEEFMGRLELKTFYSRLQN